MNNPIQLIEMEESKNNEISDGEKPVLVSGWISVKDNLPNEYDWVLVSLHSPDDDWVEMAGFSGGVFILPIRGTTTYVTHWMPIPIPATCR